MSRGKNAVKKAELLASPPVYIPPGSMPRRLELSSTGPGAGTRSVFLSFEGHTVIKSVSRSKGANSFVLERAGEDYRILRPDGSVFAENVKILQGIIHAPDQAFLNIEQRCTMNCRYCLSPLIKNRTSTLTDEKVLAMIDNAVRKGAKGVALTTGVWPDVPLSISRIAALLSTVHDRYPDMTLGAEVYAESIDDLLPLRDAGVSELKLNVEVSTPELCSVLCPQKDFGAVHSVLKDAATLFPRVTSNIIVGLGESDEDVMREAEKLAAMGVVPNIRTLRIDAQNEKTLTLAVKDGRKRGVAVKPERVSADRLLKLSYMLKDILKNHELDPGSFRTMCPACRACDIIPSADL